MKLIDLTHLITEDMPVFPGTERPKLKTANTIGKDGFKETLMTMYSHTDTHMDAPAHLYDQGASLDRLDISHFGGPAVVIDCTEFKDKPGAIITMKHLQKINAEWLNKANFVLFNTGWNAYWFDKEYYGDFPAIDHEVAHYLVKQQKKGIGVDVISIDPMVKEDLPAHQIVLSGGMVIIENLTNLEKVGSGLFTFFALPLKFINADGAPIIAVAMIDD